MKQNQTKFKILTQEQAKAFLKDGYIVIRQAFSSKTAEQLLPYVWARLNEDPDDCSTWMRASAEIQEVIKEGPVKDLFTSRYRDSLDDLVGERRWILEEGFGWLPVRFPGFSCSPWRPPKSGWHVDGIHFNHHLTSAEQGLVGIEMLTEIESGGGGTVLRVGSHKTIARILKESEPAGLSYKELRCISEEMNHFPIVEAIGKSGDVLWMHPFLIHARSPNIRHTVRIAANRGIALHKPMNLQRENDSEYSLVERAICLALDEDA